MAKANRFEQLFNSISESRSAADSIRVKLAEGALQLNRAKKICGSKEKILTDTKSEVAQLKTSNRGLKVSMVLAMIERDELVAKKNDLQQKLGKMEQDTSGLDEQSDHILRSVEASSHPQSNKS